MILATLQGEQYTYKLLPHPHMERTLHVEGGESVLTPGVRIKLANTAWRSEVGSWAERNASPVALVEGPAHLGSTTNGPTSLR